MTVFTIGLLMREQRTGGPLWLVAPSGCAFLPGEPGHPAFTNSRNLLGQRFARIILTLFSDDELPGKIKRGSNSTRSRSRYSHCASACRTASSLFRKQPS